LALNEELARAAKELALAVQATGEYAALRTARNRLERDAGAQALLADFNAAQRLGEHDLVPGDFAGKRERLLEHPVIKAYLQAEEDFIKLCRQLNPVISEALGVDFGSVCRPPVARG